MTPESWKRGYSLLCNRSVNKFLCPNIHATVEKLLETVFSMQPMQKLWSWVPWDPKPTMTAGEGQQQFTAQTLVEDRETEKYGHGSFRAQNQE
jgi:hypothetical protein